MIKEDPQESSSSSMSVVGHLRRAIRDLHKVGEAKISLSLEPSVVSALLGRYFRVGSHMGNKLGQ